MITTTRKHLRKPELADNPDVPRDVGNLADDLDRVANFDAGNLGARPPTTGPGAATMGDRYLARDDVSGSPNGTEWVLDNGAWVYIGRPADPAANIAGARTLGVGAQQAAAGNDSRLSDPRTPTAHVATHRAGGSDEASHISTSARPILDVGILGQIRAGRVLTLADFTTLLGITAPTGLWNLSNLTDISGSGRDLTNKGAVPFGGAGIEGNNTVAIFAGSTAQALYRTDTGAADPFRISMGSWGAWFRTAKLGIGQFLITKDATGGVNRGWYLWIDPNNRLEAAAPSQDGNSQQAVAWTSTPTADDRWHFAVATFDGTFLRIYLDGIEESVAVGGGPMFGSTAPLNIGARGADGATVANSPFYGRIDEAFVTSDVLSDDQIRVLYAAKIAHGFAATPNEIILNVRRRRKGSALASGDFPTAPLRLYPGSSLVNAGSGGALGLTNNGGAVVASAPDGSRNGAFALDGVNDYLSASDAGLPTGLTACSMGLWTKFASNGSSMIHYGAAGGRRTLYGNTGEIAFTDGVNNVSSGGKQYWDGQWHFIVAVIDNAAADGVKVKVYLDGQLIVENTAFATTTLGGASGLRIGTDNVGTAFHFGSVASPFVTDYAMTPEQLLALYMKGSLVLPPSPKNVGDHIEAIDATNLYAVHDTLGSQNQIDYKVAA